MTFLNKSVVFPRRLTCVKLFGFAALFVVAAMWCAASQADIVMSLTKITNESDVFSNVPNAVSAKYAINYGQQQVGGPIDGVTFVNHGASYYTVYSYTDGESTVYNGYNTPQLSFNSRNIKGMTNHAGNTYSGTASADLNMLLGAMLFNDGELKNSTAAMTFGNLEAGKTYTARFLTRSWGTNNPNRQHTFSIDLDADGVADSFTYGGNTVTGQLVSEDQPFSGETYAGAYAVDFTFTAQCNTATISLLSGGTDNQAWHHYGVMLIETNAEQVKPTTPMLYNGSFEADKWTFLNNTDSGHGYLDNANAGIISGWQFTNLTNTAMRAGMAWVGGPCKDFIGTQTPTDGNQLAWIQSGSNVDARLYQNIYGFDPTDKDTVYRVTMDLGGRTATGNPSVSLFIGANQATEDTYINSKEVTKGKFKEYSAVFVPNAEMQTIAIRNQTSGDTSLLVDNVQLKAYTLTTFFSDNYQVSGNRKGSNIGKNDSDPEDRFGGLLGAMAYKVSVASNDQIQVGNGDTFPQGGTGTCEGSLFFATHNNGYEQSHASPDYNFANVGAMSAADEGGRMYDISFRVAPQYDEDAGSSNWAAILFGLSEGKQTTANVNGGDGVGILFRRNGGIQVFDRTSCIVDLGGGTFTLKDDWADVRLVFYVPAFDGTSPVEVSLYVNEILISSFQTAKGFSNNFIQLEAYSGNSGYKRSLMDDLVIKSTAELQYDVSRIQDMTRAWSPNGKDKLTTIVFNAPNVKEDSNVNHTGALKMEANTTIDIGEGLTLLQSGGISGNYDLTKTGEGTLQIYNEAENGVDIQHLIASSGRLDVKGVMKGSIQVKRGATFSPGNSVGTVDISGEFIADAYAKLLFEQDASGMDVLTASSYDIDGDAEIILDITAIIPGATYDIIVNSSDAGFNAEQGVESYWLGLMSDFPYYMNLSVVDNHMVRLYIDPNAVPEPSTWALLVLGVVVLFLRKRS